MSAKQPRKPKHFHAPPAFLEDSQDASSGSDSQDASSGCSRCRCSRCVAGRSTRRCKDCGTIQGIEQFQTKGSGYRDSSCNWCRSLADRIRLRPTAYAHDALDALRTASTVHIASDILRQLVKRHGSTQELAGWLTHILDSATAQGRMRDAAHILAGLAVIGGLSVLATPDEIRDRINGHRRAGA